MESNGIAEQLKKAVKPTDGKESKVFGVSVRGWITLSIVWTVCLMAMTGKDIPDVLANGFSMAIGFYLAQKIQEMKG